jgi:hypothetical protein
MTSVRWVVAAVLLAACSGARSQSAPAVEKAPNPPAARNDSLEPGMLGTVRALPVEGWTGPGGRPFEVALRSRDVESGHARRFGTITLRTTLRGTTPDLVQWPCTSCHLGRTVTMTAKRIPDAHQNIQPKHPELLRSTCSTCHSPDAVDMLALRNGDRAGLDQSYRICSQCHFAQANAWAGGGHGKRLDGWQGRRVVMGCTDCHDPHRPQTVPRIPFRPPTIERVRSAP